MEILSVDFKIIVVKLVLYYEDDGNLDSEMYYIY